MLYPPRLGPRQGRPLTTSIQRHTENSSDAIGKKRNKKYTYWKDKIELPLFADNIIIYVEKSHIINNKKNP